MVPHSDTYNHKYQRNYLPRMGSQPINSLSEATYGDDNYMNQVRNYYSQFTSSSPLYKKIVK